MWQSTRTFCSEGFDAPLILAAIRAAPGPPSDIGACNCLLIGKVLYDPSPNATFRNHVTRRQKAIGVDSISLLDHIKGFAYPLRMLSTQYLIAYGFNNASTVRILSGITIIWQARSLRESQFL